MAEFAYNNAKNANIGYTLFELNCGYYPQILYKDDSDLWSKFKLADKLSAELRECIIVCYKNLQHTQKL